MRTTLLILAAACITQPASAQSIDSIEEISGFWTGQQWQRYPYEACSNIDSDSRVVIGRSEYNDTTGEVEFRDDAPLQIQFYESGCDLGDSLSAGGQLAMAGKCGAEGEDYEGIVTFERIDAHTIKVKTPVNDMPVVLASCIVDHSLIANPQPAGKLAYGSRAGMDVTVVGQSAIGTAAARIYVQHTVDDARAFCMEYEMSVDPGCIERAMTEAEAFQWSVGADCVDGSFDTVTGQKYRFAGETYPRRDHDPVYAIYPAAGGDLLDGSSASGYGVALAVFSALCPDRVKPAS